MIDFLHAGTRFDLHLHTQRSDGAHSPDEVLRRCARGGLDVVALTDHDLETSEPGVHEVEGRRLYVLGGAEISGVHEGREYHLLVYFPGSIPDGFRAFCRAQCLERAERFTTAMQNLDLDAADPLDAEALEGKRALTRLHLAHALVKHGRARSSSDAFSRFLSERHGHVPRLSYPLVDAIRLAREHGGITSWAHPAVQDIERHLDTFVAAGLQGIEGLRPCLDARDRNFFRRTARRYGLFLTGGSDWHGWTDANPGLFRLQATELRDFLDTLMAA